LYDYDECQFLFDERMLYGDENMVKPLFDPEKNPGIHIL
jgi:hypothetical protein